MGDMRRKPIRRQSDRGKLIERMDDIFRKILKLERGRTCEICGRSEDFSSFPLSVFHILPKGKYGCMRYHRRNVILACWVPYLNSNFCHNAWHHCCENEVEYKKVKEGIIKKLGENYWEELLILDKIQPRHDTFYLRTRYEVFKMELKTLKE